MPALQDEGLHDAAELAVVRSATLGIVACRFRVPGNNERE